MGPSWSWNGQEYEYDPSDGGCLRRFRRPEFRSFVRSSEEDPKRRDFTVNAFALNEVRNCWPLFMDRRFGKQVFHWLPNERFNEDALRIMRGF